MAMAKRAAPGPTLQGPPPPADCDGAPDQASDSELEEGPKPDARRRVIASKSTGRGKPVLPATRRGTGRPMSGVRCHLRAGLSRPSMLLTSALFGAAEGCFATIEAGTQRQREGCSWRRTEDICVATATGAGDEASACLTQVMIFRFFENF